MKKNYLVLLFALIPFLFALNVAAQDETVLSDIHKRLSTPGYEARHDQDRMMFVGEIIALGPVFQGVCKQAVNESVDIHVLEIFLGEAPGETVHAGYINCTRAPLPPPPFTLHAKVIVYCFHNMGSFHCLVPVTFSEGRLKRVKSWISNAAQ
jgi:hypothetical protein